MTRGTPMDPDRPAPTNRAPLDEAGLAMLVRGVADEWSLPPQRLDALTWRDRVSPGYRAANGSTGGRGTLRLLGAAAVAVVATVSLSFAAVWLGQRGETGTRGATPSARASSSPAPSANAAPVASPLPKLFRVGDLPDPSRLLVQTSRGYHIADLTTGELSQMIMEKSGGSKVLLPRPSGGWVCICGDGANAIRLAAATVDTNGVVGAPVPIRDIVGTEDPSASSALQPFLTDVSVTASPDGRLALIGWVYRDGEAGWQIGADLIDLESLATVASTQLLLDQPIVIDGRPRLPFAPIVRLSPAGDRILLAILASVDETGRGPGPGAGHWVASFDGRSIGDMADASVSTGDSCREFDAGLIGADPLTDDAVYYAACSSPAGQLVVNRISADGRPVSANEFPGSAAAIDTGTLAPIVGDAFFAWNPVGAVLSRLDLRSGELSVGEPHPPNITGPKNPLGNPVVVSADGTRVYAIGSASSDSSGGGDSAGVYAFDASTLAPLGHWAAQADLTSIAVSEDGRHVFAAAPGGPNAAGGPGPEFGASITVYDTSDGSVTLLAGRLGAFDLTLGDEICR